MEKILSVVIPTYNMETYLDNCLNSFIFDKDEKGLEILIVNDGSKDKSAEIAKKYVEQYPDIFVFIDKENGGHGSTINAGLKVAQGKYFKVVDADDWVNTQEFEKFFNSLKLLNVDCIVCNYMNCYENFNKHVLQNCMVNEVNKIYDLNNLEKYNFIMHSNTYKTDVIKAIRLQEHCFYVDVEYNIYAYAKCNTCIYLDYNVYQYRLGRIGQSVSLSGFYKHRENHKTVAKNIIKFVESNTFSDIKRKNIEHYVNSIIVSIYLHAIFTYHFGNVIKDEIIKFDNELKNHVEFYNLSNKLRVIRSLRKHDFKNLDSKNRFFRFKQFVKKIIGKK